MTISRNNKRKGAPSHKEKTPLPDDLAKPRHYRQKPKGNCGTNIISCAVISFKALLEDQRRLFEEIKGAETECHMFEEVHLFEYAFSMGVLTMLEVFGFRQDRTEELK